MGGGGFLSGGEGGGVFVSRGGGGVVLSRGWMEVMSRGEWLKSSQIPSPGVEHTDVCENITFARFPIRAAIYK